MKINKSQKMNIEFSDEERELFRRTEAVLGELKNEMENFQCDTVECGWADAPSYVYKDDIRKLLGDLSELESATYIYNKENVK